MLRAKDKLIVEEYFVNGYKKADAYQKYHTDASRVTCRSNSYHFFKKPHIQEEVSKRFKELKDYYDGIIDAQIVETYFIRATYDPMDIIDEAGDLREDIPEELKKCIDGIEPNKIKLADRDKALAQLMKYRKLVTDSVNISGDIKVEGTTFVVGGEHIE